MRLRPRLALATLTVSVPMVLSLVAWDAHSKQRAAQAELIEFTRVLMASPGWLEHCEANPELWRGRPPQSGRPPRPPAGAPRFHPLPHSQPATFVAYGTDLRSPNPEAPQLTASDAAALRDTDAVAVATPWYDSNVRVLVRSPRESGACAFVLAQGTTEPWLGGILPASQIWLLPLVAVFAAVLLAVGPVVRRIRVLTRAVREAADSQYESGVPTSGQDEVAELGRAFDAAARRIRQQLIATQRSEAALREFLANTTHDIMLPLTVLHGHLAELESASSDDVARARTLMQAMNEAHYLGALIHNLAIAAKLDAAPDESGAEAQAPLLRSTVDLGALVERVVNRHRPIARAREVSIEQAIPPSPLAVSADVTLLEQAASNLVYNAVRYNRAGGHVAVIAEARGERFVLSVIDDGAGIPEAELARAVERGFRGNEARSRAPDGQGLGLSITLRVAKLHGFELRFKRSEYGGLHVELEGPVLDAESC